MRTAVTFRAISAWPNNIRATATRKHGPFRTRWLDALEELDTELVHLKAWNVVLELDCPAVDIRKDGMPKADARVRSPGVILQFEKRYPSGKVDRYVYPCDTFHDWQDNVLAIARSLNALRMVDRYGVTKSGEQYAGFKQLPGAGGAGTPMTAAAAAAWLAAHHGFPAAQLLADPGAARTAVRVARAKAHPDAGGSTDVFATAERVRDALMTHHGVTL